MPTQSLLFTLAVTSFERSLHETQGSWLILDALRLVEYVTTMEAFFGIGTSIMIVQHTHISLVIHTAGLAWKGRKLRLGGFYIQR
ncbi:hypothetical protein RRG08_056670 [Elysia crispata]|uniref:Uncharacterized protein n=1 Tax=Elysia crispata TaxID=231223 RepID=A0AAE0YGH1_9GAST|nr:hypothetical protein RRG08_056670 [Elysia crispata]